MQINNPKNSQQSNTKLKRKLRHTMTSYEARGYELAYAEYNLIHYNLTECESVCQGTLGNQSKRITVKEIF